jgi:hypothetical protein
MATAWRRCSTAACVDPRGSRTTFAGPLLAGSVASQPLDVFIAGDDDAKAKVSGSSRTADCARFDAGLLRRARAGGGRLLALRVGAEGLALIALGKVLCG